MSTFTLTVSRLLRRRFSKTFGALLFLTLVICYVFPKSPAGHIAELITGSPVKRHSLVFDEETGLAKDWVKGEPKHPIEVLMERGKKKWERMLRR